MITEIWAKNYRSLQDVHVKLSPITVLVGQNGSGKSNFLDVPRFIGESVGRNLFASFTDREGVASFRYWSAPNETVEVGLRIESPHIEATYAFTLSGEPYFWIEKERCEINTGEGSTGYETEYAQWVHEPSEYTPQIRKDSLVLPLLSGLPFYKSLFDYITQFSFYNILPTVVAKPQGKVHSYPLDENGQNLASALFHLQNSNSSQLTNLRDALRYTIPGVVDFNVVDFAQAYLVPQLKRDMGNGKNELFTLSQESDGTLRLLGLLTALHQTPPRMLIGLEEPELAVHPGVLPALWEEIEMASEHSQIIITTHSPDLLDMCRSEQLRVVENVNGATLIDEIEDEQKQIIRERLFAPGELLRANGLRRRSGQRAVVS